MQQELSFTPEVKDKLPMTMLVQFHDELVYFFNAVQTRDPKHEGWVISLRHQLLDHLESKRLGDPRRPQADR